MTIEELNRIKTEKEKLIALRREHTDQADPAALRHAIYLAIDAFRNRETYDEAASHPLPKLYHERKDESEKVRFAIPKKHENVTKDKKQE